MQTALIALSIALIVWGPETEAAEDASAITVTGCPVSLIDESQVPARSAGQLIAINVTEGQAVKPGDLLAKIDDAVVLRNKDVKFYQLQAAEKEAGNDVNVRYAKWANMVADAEYQQAVEANQQATGAVPQAELRRLLLERGKTALAIEQAQHDLEISSLNVNVRRAELQAVEQELEMYQIVAPIEGVVVKRFFHQGEWVKPGDTVFRIVRMDRLRVEAMLSAEKYTAAQLDRARAVLRVRLPPGVERSFEGQVVFVSPLVDVGMEFPVWAEVENVRDERSGHWLLRPGLSGTLTIHPTP